MNRTLFSLLISIFSFHFSVGQPKADTAFVLSAVSHARETYTKALGEHTGLHNGLEHKHYRDDIEPDAYLEPDWTDGSIFYDGQLYQNVPLMYDMIVQRVVTFFPGQV